MTKENYILLTDGDCILKIMPFEFESNNTFWILGLNFFHNYYIIFDMDNESVGIAESILSDFSRNFVDLTPES